ncbi:M23 family metallopeptidase [Kibdelosporangium philippinense]|uniref:M23 family metallopeptidase n=1 Tax=Kibdelosporangium philippinense TaxID=211113 RepID=UPI003611AD48
MRLFLQLTAMIVALLIAAPATAAAPLSSRTRTHFSWPLPPPHPVVRPFIPPVNPYGPGHRGVDIGGVAGQEVMAAADGLVIHAGAVVDRSLVSLEHSGGLRTTYEPVTPAVARGQRVRRGDVIGHLLDGHCPVACLHWGARRARTT